MIRHINTHISSSGSLFSGLFSLKITGRIIHWISCNLYNLIKKDEIQFLPLCTKEKHRKIFQFLGISFPAIASKYWYDQTVASFSDPNRFFRITIAWGFSLMLFGAFPFALIPFGSTRNEKNKPTMIDRIILATRVVIFSYGLFLLLFTPEENNTPLNKPTRESDEFLKILPLETIEKVSNKPHNQS